MVTANPFCRISSFNTLVLGELVDVSEGAVKQSAPKREVPAEGFCSGLSTLLIGSKGDDVGSRTTPKLQSGLYSAPAPVATLP